MNNQNATLNAPSIQEWSDDLFYTCAKRSAERQSKGLTRERAMLKRQSLISAVCADYRAHFTALYGKTERLPSDIFTKVENAVDKVITEYLSTVNANNVISYRRAFKHNEKNMSVSERVTVTGENIISLKEQHLGIVLFIGSAEKRLTDLQAKKTPDYDLEKEVILRIAKLNATKAFIEQQLAQQSAGK